MCNISSWLGGQGPNENFGKLARLTPDKTLNIMYFLRFRRAYRDLRCLEKMPTVMEQKLQKDGRKFLGIFVSVHS